MEDYLRRWGAFGTISDELVDLAHTAAVLGEQRGAALALHQAGATGNEGTYCTGCADYYPCQTARALGVAG